MKDKRYLSMLLFFRILVFTSLLIISFPISGHSQLIEQTRITELMERWRIYNLANKEVRGWRIQILATVDRRQLENVERTFERRYPEYPTHFAHNEPYYHLKVGAFLTTQKAQAFLKKMQKEYPAALLVTDFIKAEELLLYDQ